MKYFVTSDVHSYYQPMKKALDEAGFDPNNENHTLVVDGDLFDRGDDTREVYDYVKNLPRKILIRGNHEDLLEGMIERGDYHLHDVSNGTLKTIWDLNEKEPLDYVLLELDEVEVPADTPATKGLVEWIDDNFVDYAEFSKYIVVHSYLPCETVWPNNWEIPNQKVRMKNWRKAGLQDWKDSRWSNPYDYSIRIGGVPKGKKIIAGHWNASYAWHKTTGTPEYEVGANHGIWEGKDLIMIDACTAISGKCNVFTFEDSKPPKLGKTRSQW